MAGKLRRVVCLTLLTVTLLSACGRVETFHFDDSPSEISTAELPDGTLVRLEHQYGPSLETAVADGKLAVPILWDGTWRIRTGREVFDVVVGDRRHQKRPLRLAGDDLLNCWRTGDEPNTTPRATTSYGVRCSQTLLLHLAAEHGYPAAAGAISHAREGLGEDANLWGWYCNIAGEAAAVGAIFGGADPRTLMRDEESFCDYSVLHGAGAAVVFTASGDPVKALENACAADPNSPLPELARTSQCWHGGGMGIARLTGGDTLDGAAVCMKADSEASRLNCLDGMFSFARTYLLRGDGIADTWPALVVNLSSCARTGGSEPLVEACYRSAAQSAVRHAAASIADSHDVREQVVTDMQRACAHSGTHAVSCWTGMGTLVANTLHPDIDEPAEVRRWVKACAEAPEGAAMSGCYERVLLGLLRNDQLVNGLPVEDLVVLAPANLRTDIEAKLRFWQSTLGGRSN